MLSYEINFIAANPMWAFKKQSEICFIECLLNFPGFDLKSRSNPAGKYFYRNHSVASHQFDDKWRVDMITRLAGVHGQYLLLIRYIPLGCSRLYGFFPRCEAFWMVRQNLLENHFFHVETNFVSRINDFYNWFITPKNSKHPPTSPLHPPPLHLIKAFFCTKHAHGC